MKETQTKNLKSVYCFKRQITSQIDGGTYSLPCNKRDCDCVRCREVWARKMAGVIIAVNNRHPFTHLCRFTPIQQEPYMMAGIIREVLKRVYEWCLVNNEHLDYYMVPEKQSKVHWNGVMRLSSAKVLKKIKTEWRKMGQGSHSHSIVEPKTAKGGITYCVKWNRQMKIAPVKSEGKHLVIRSKNVFRKK